MLNKSQINTHLMYAINELRALELGEYESGTQESNDRISIAERFRAMAESIEAGGCPPDISAIIPRAMALPIQN